MSEEEMTKLRYVLLLTMGLATLMLGGPSNTPDAVQAAPNLRADCLPYNPNALYVFNDGGIWILTDDVSRMEAFASESDAQLGMQVARMYTQQCFIGRNNTRPNRQDYIFTYWQGDSGLGGSLPTNDCLSHNRSALTIVNEGANGWLLTDGSSRMVMFDNQTDAQQGLDLVRNYDQICYIGRGTGYIMTYLRVEMLVIVPGFIPAAGPASEDCSPTVPPAWLCSTTKLTPTMACNLLRHTRNNVLLAVAMLGPIARITSTNIGRAILGLASYPPLPTA
jgi:hypothetical protein